MIPLGTSRDDSKQASNVAHYGCFYLHIIYVYERMTQLAGRSRCMFLATVGHVNKHSAT